MYMANYKKILNLQKYFSVEMEKVEVDIWWG